MKYFKHTLSLFLTVLMLFTVMSAIVPEADAAATAQTYYVRLHVHEDNSFNPATDNSYTEWNSGESTDSGVMLYALWKGEFL